MSVPLAQQPGGSCLSRPFALAWRCLNCNIPTDRSQD
jgi:hypothetical protein